MLFMETLNRNTNILRLVNLCKTFLKRYLLLPKLTIAILIVFLYSFQINVNGKNPADKKTNDTSGSKEITFIHVGDTHYNTDSDDFEEQRKQYRQTLEIMNNIVGTPYPDEVDGEVGKPMGVFVIGDLTEAKQSDFDAFAEDWGLKGSDGLLDFPVYEGAGNHDGPPSTDPNSVVRRSIIERNPHRPHLASLSENKLHYSLDYKGVHFVQLNEYAGLDDDKRYAGNVDYNRKGQAYGNPSEKSLQFLEKTLEKNVGQSGRPVILFQHYGFDRWPLSPWSDDLAWWTEEHALRLWETIEGYNVIAILVGHEHSHDIIEWNGIPVYQMDAKRGFGVYRIKNGEMVRVIRDLPENTWGSVSEPQNTSVFAGPPEELVQGPYLIYEDNPSEMTVLWRTNSPGEVDFRWGQDEFEFEEGEKQVEPYDDEYNLYRITLTDLEPNERYTYQLQMDDKYELGMFYSAPAHDAEKVKFMVYGATAAGLNEHESISSALYDKIYKDPAYHSLLVHTGNWVPRINSISSWDVNFFSYGRKKPYPKYIQKRMPIMGTVRNSENDISLLKKLFPYDFADETYYSYRYGPVHINVMDPALDYSEGSPQHTWLVNELEETTAPWKIIVFSDEQLAPKETIINDSRFEIIQSLAEKYDVDLLIGRSNKGYSRKKIGEVNYIGLGAEQNKEEYNSQTMYYGTVQIEDDTLTLKIFNDAGEIVPTLELGK